MSTHGEFSKEPEVLGLLIHIEKVCEEGIRVETIFFDLYLFCSSRSLIRPRLLINQFSIFKYSIQLQLGRLVLSVNGFFYVYIAFGIDDSIFFNQILGVFLFFHLKMNPEKGEICLGKVFGIIHFRLLSADWAGNDLVVPNLEDALFTECVATLTQNFR